MNAILYLEKGNLPAENQFIQPFFTKETLFYHFASPP